MTNPEFNSEGIKAPALAPLWFVQLEMLIPAGVESFTLRFPDICTDPSPGSIRG